MTVLRVTQQAPESPKAGSQISWYWSGLSLGDAVHPANDKLYNYTYLRTYHRIMMNAMWNPQEFCILPTSHSTYSGYLAPTNPAGTTLRMSTGAALVDGFLYTNDANIDFDLSAPGHYRLVLRRVLELRTVVSAIIGPDLGGPPNFTYDPPLGVVEINLARVYSDGSTLTIIDDRTFFRNLRATKRQGGHERSYHTAGTTDYVLDNLTFQVGSFEVTATTGNEEFPESFNTLTGAAHGNEPIVFLSAFPTTGAPDSARLTVTGIDGDGGGASWAISSTTNLDRMLWMAIGGVCIRNSPV